MTEDVLRGLLVVEFAEGIAGPFCGQLLSDLGARVVKVEPPEGDWGRALEVPDGYSPVFLGCNRSKESVSVDLRAPGGSEVVQRLAARADVFLAAYRPGVAERNGLGPDELCGRNERLVYCALSGYGDRGPKRERPGSDTILQAYSGLMSSTGEADRAPARVGTAIGDTAAGVYAAVGILALLLRREQTGVGGRCDTSLLEALLHLQTTTFSDLFAGIVPKRLGSRSSLSAVPAEAFPTADGFLSVSCHAPRQWRRLCRALGHPEWEEDPLMLDNPERVANHDYVADTLGAVLRTRATAEWMTIFEAEGVNAGPIHTHDEVLKDEHVAATGIFRPLHSERWGEFTLLDMPITFDGETDPPPAGDPPLLGEHNRAVLAELGYAEGEIEALSEAGAIRSPAPR